ncbi:MAG: GTP cyclohydrolase II [Rhodobacteraceae bacterium]|nr:GTP cyclohydrolase II [Paracoccaceae bacterium]
MFFSPDLVEILARVRSDLRMGVPAVLTGDQDALILAVETLDNRRLGRLLEMTDDVDLVITGRRAETLKARAYDDDVARIVLPSKAQLEWIRGVADPADDLMKPMKGPLETRRDGSPRLHRIAIAIAKSARLLPAVLVAPLQDGGAFAAANNLTAIAAQDAEPQLGALSPLARVVAARVPLRAAEQARVHVFRPCDGGEEHYAIEVGRPNPEAPVLARLHSACFTGDIMGSLKCDCGPQLNAALTQMGEEGAGVLLYLNQEGRGIGLANKMRAYSLQDQGFDTVEANHRLGFEDDERDFRIGSEILGRMGISKVRLMTNNPNKISMMEARGIAVSERVPLKVGENPHNVNYLATKSRKSGHFL